MATQLFDLTGKIALVSGASRGIGEEIAKLLADGITAEELAAAKPQDLVIWKRDIRSSPPGGTFESVSATRKSCMPWRVVSPGCAAR